MKLYVLSLILLAGMATLSCSKDKDDNNDSKADFTAVVGDWKNFGSSDVNIFSITGRGIIVAVSDAKINSDALNSGTLYLYVRYQNSTSTSYNLIPYNDSGLGSVSKSEFANTGVVLSISKKPSEADEAKYSIRGIIIPAGKSIPSSINVQNYTEVANFLKFTP